MNAQVPASDLRSVLPDEPRPAPAEEGAVRGTSLEHVPFVRHLGVEGLPAEPGQARLRLALKPELTNLMAAAHGGIVMTLLDIVMARAALSSRPEWDGCIAVTIDMSTQFLSPGRGVLVADGKLVGGGRSVSFCEGTVSDEDGTVVARGMGSFKVLDKKKPV